MKLLSLKLLALFPALIIIAGVAVRLININQSLLEFFPPRQTQTAEISRNIYVNGWPDFWTPKVRYFTPRQDSGQAGTPVPYVLEFPLYNGMVAILYHLFSPSVILGRHASLTFFVASSIVFYKLLMSTLAHNTSLITNNQLLITNYALLFFTFSPLHILVSRSFQPEELALFLLLLAIYKKSWLVFSLSVLTKLPIVLFSPVILYRTGLKKSSLSKLFLSLLPSLIWYYRASKLTIHPAIVRNFDISNWFQPQLWFKPNWYFSLFQIEHVWILTTLGLLFFWIGFWRIVIQRRLLTVIIASLRGSPKANRGNPVFWLVWLASGILYLAVFNYHAMTHEYYHLFLLPPLSVIAGIGVTSIYSNVSKHWSKSIFTAGIILMIIGSLSLPAMRKIISAPNLPEESTEVTVNRYHLIEDY